MAEYRQWRETKRIELHDAIPINTPYNLSFEVSSLCNARCVYCAHSREHGQFEGNMSKDLFNKILSDMKGFQHNIKKAGMFGFGESLCNPLLPDMVTAIKQSGKVDAIDITTNGMLLTHELSDKLIDSGIATIRISLQGLDADAYRNICGVNINYGRFLEELQYLYNHRGNAKVRMKIADIAIADIQDGEKKFEDMFGPMADSIFIEHIMPIYSNINYDNIDTSIKADALYGREKVKQDHINKVCHRAFYRCRIRANGDITAACCDSTQDVIFGNVYKENLVDVWNGEKRKQFLIRQLKGERFQIPECRNCMMPNDITTKADLLDPWAEEILKKMEE